MQPAIATMTDAPVDDVRTRLERARQLLEDNLAEDLPLADLAAAAELSPFHFHRLFRGLIGEPVAAHVRRLRLERAAHRLRQTDDEILTVAVDVGYSSNEAFTRAFARRFGVTPSAYRDGGDEPSWGGGGGGDDRPPIEVSIRSREPARVAAIRHTGPYDGVGAAWKALFKWGWRHMLFGKPVTFGLCHDDPDVTPPEQCRYDACLVVKPGVKLRGPVHELRHPGGTFAVARHLGPYEQMEATYSALFARVVSGPVGGTQYRLGDPPSLEVYLNDPRKTAPEDLVTDVWMPVQ